MRRLYWSKNTVKGGGVILGAAGGYYGGRIDAGPTPPDGSDDRHPVQFLTDRTTRIPRNSPAGKPISR